MDSRLVLPENTLLDGGYRIERVLGTGGFGITYEAFDLNLRTGVALKEYYPFDFGDRDTNMSVRPKSERHRQTFEWGRASFLEEARTLARFDHPSIVRVARAFEANSTAYMVMRLEKGQSFEAWLKGLGRPPTQAELDRITALLLDALEILHAEDFLHRDIAPDNIIVRANGTPVLLDFGSARRAVAEMSRTLTGIVKAGYSPQEQYASDARMQGPWSDIYALGGTLYRAVTGRQPEEATLRLIEDQMPPAAKTAEGTYRPGFLAGIDACLRTRHVDRPQSVSQLRPLLLGEAQPALAETQRLLGPPPTVSTTEPARPASSRRWLYAAAALALVGGSYGGFQYVRWSAAERTRQEHEATRVTAAVAAKKQADAEEAKGRADTEARRIEEARAAAERRAAEERARQEEAKRQADAAAARKKADDEALARVHAEAKRLQEAEAKRPQEEARIGAEKRAADERARQEADAKRQADAAAARKKADDEALAKVHAEAKRLQEAEAKRLQEAEAKRQQEAARVGAEKRAAEDKTNQAAQAEREFQQGERYLYGRGVPKDYAIARDAYEKAAAAGNNGGMNGLGWLYENGFGVARDYAKARELYERAVAAGNPYAMSNLGRLYRNGWGAPRNYAKARELFEKAAATGNPPGMANLGFLYESGRGVPRDYTKARDWYEKAAAAGNNGAMNGLGWLHQNGFGVPQDYAKAREWYEKAAATGNGFAMANIGWLYRDGHGVARDYAKAREWFEKSAAAGNGAGMYGLGVLYMEGLGVPKDYAKARELYEKATAAGNDFGMNGLGWLYQNGFGVPQDYAKAREWYEKAVTMSNRFALARLAALLDQGKGGPTDFPRAAKLLLEAARLNNAGAIKDLRGIMENWRPRTREELKRELSALGHYKGPLHDVWDNSARAAVDKFLDGGK